MAGRLTVKTVIALGLFGLLTWALLWISASPITWDEIVYMQAAHAGTVVPVAPFRTVHVLLLSLFMNFSDAPIEATKLFWAASMAAMFMLPWAMFNNLKSLPRRAAALLAFVYIVLVLSFDFFWWTPGIVYPDYTMALFYAASLVVFFRSNDDENPYRFWILGGLFGLAFFVKETALPLLVLPFMVLVERGIGNRQAWRRIVVPYCGGIVLAIFAVLLMAAAFLDLRLDNIATIIHAWLGLNFGAPTRDGESFISYLSRIENPSLLCMMTALAVYATIYRDRTLGVLSALGWLLLLLLSVSAFFSTATISGRYMMPLVPILLAALVWYVHTWETRHPNDNLLLECLLPMAVAILASGLLYFGDGAAILAESAGTSVAVLNKALLLPMVFFIMIGSLSIMPRSPRVGCAILLFAVAFMAIYPNQSIANSIKRRDVAKAAAHRFEDMAALAAIIRQAGDVRPIMMEPTFYPAVLNERGEMFTRAMLGFFVGRPLTKTEAFYLPASEPVHTPGWVLANKDEKVSAEGVTLTLQSTAGAYNLYRSE